MSNGFKDQRKALEGTFAYKHSMNQRILKRDNHLQRRLEREERKGRKPKETPIESGGISG